MQRDVVSVAIVCLIVSLLSQATNAKILYASPSGRSIASCETQEDSCDLRSAVGAAFQNDTVLLLPGVYTDAVNISIWHPITIGAYNTSIGATRVVIQIPNLLYFSSVIFRIHGVSVSFYNIDVTDSHVPVFVMHRSEVSPDDIPTLSISDSVFTKNAVDLFAIDNMLPLLGAVVMADGSVEIHRCNFTANGVMYFVVSQPDTPREMVGGAVAVGLRCGYPTSVVVTDSIFEDNFLSYALWLNLQTIAGGAIGITDLVPCTQYKFPEPMPFSNITLSGATFLGNRLTSHVYNVGPARKTYPSGVRASETEQLYRYGGAVSVSASTATNLEVESCNFTDNFIDVVSPKNGGPSYGGALHATLRQQTSTATFTKSLFQRNKAVGGASESLDGAGGGNGLGGAVSLISTTLWQFNECLFFSNSAAGGIGAALGGSGTGGAIHYQSDTAEIAHTSAGVALYGSIFKDNLVRSGSTFHIGYAGSPAHGGAIAYNFQATSYVQVVQVVQCSFISNKAESKQGGNAGGGAMFVIRNRQIELDPFVQVSFVNTSFIDNVVKNTEGIDQAGASTGGALHLQIIGTSHFINQVFFQNVQFVGNHIDNSVSSGQGGALFMSSPVGGPKASPIQMLDCMFTANVVGLKESNLVHNSGAAMYLTTGVNMLVRRTTFRSNTVIAATILSTSCGGAIFSTYQIASEECTFYGNSVVSELSRAAGGAVCVGYWFKATNTVFRRNFARGKVVFGGAISGVLSQDPSQIQGVLLVNSTFDDNSLMVTDGGDGLGGSIYSHGFPFQVHNSTISNSHIVNEQQQSMFGSGGGAIACEAKMPFALNNVRIENCYAPNGGALYITNTRSFYAGILSNNQFINNRASLSGGAIFVHHNTFQNSSYIDYLCPVFDSRVTIEENNEFINNTAVYGVDCGFLPLEISFLHQPENIWPGLIFSLTFVQVDFLGDIIIAPMEFQLLPSSSKFGVALTTGLVYDKVIPNNGGIYRYNMLQTTLPTGSTIQVVLMTPTLLVNNVTFELLVAPCPLGFHLITRGEAFECAPCDPLFYNLDGEKCIPCPRKSEVEGGSTLSTEELDECMQFEGLSSHSEFIIKEGFWPVPRLASPEELILCPNHEACKEFKCELELINSVTWTLDCSKECPANRTALEMDCQCTDGYSDRLCSRCICDDSTFCWFSTSSEDMIECHKCAPTNTGIIAAALVVLQLSLVFFMIFNASAVGLFLAEVAIVVFLILLGLGEWWMFDALLILTLLFIISSRSGTHDIGYVKILLFFLQTTTVIVSHATWPTWVSGVLSRLESLNLRVSGLECINPTLFSNPLGRFLFFMALPWLISVLLIIAAVISALLLRIPLVRRLQQAKCCKKDKTKLILQQPPKGVEDDHTLSGGDHDPLLGEFDPSSDPTHPSLPPSREQSDTNNCEPRDMIDDHHRAHKHKHSTLPILHKIAHLVLFLLFASYFELSNTVLSIVKPCDEHGFMMSYPWIPCTGGNTAEFLRLLTIGSIFLVVYFVGIPFLFGLLLVRNRHRIHNHDEQIEHQIGFLYESYKPSVYWFEMVWIGRRAAISIIVTLIPDSSNVRVALIALVMLGSLFLQRQAMPFTSKLANYLEALSTAVLLYSFVVGHALEGIDANFWPLKHWIQTFVWLLNVGVVLGLIGAMLWPAIVKLRQKLATRCRCCSHKNRAHTL